MVNGQVAAIHVRNRIRYQISNRLTSHTSRSAVIIKMNTSQVASNGRIRISAVNRNAPYPPPPSSQRAVKITIEDHSTEDRVHNEPQQHQQQPQQSGDWETPHAMQNVTNGSVDMNPQQLQHTIPAMQASPQPQQQLQTTHNGSNGSMGMEPQQVQHAARLQSATNPPPFVLQSPQMAQYPHDLYLTAIQQQPRQLGNQHALIQEGINGSPGAVHHPSLIIQQQTPPAALAPPLSYHHLDGMPNGNNGSMGQYPAVLSPGFAYTLLDEETVDRLDRVSPNAERFAAALERAIYTGEKRQELLKNPSDRIDQGIVTFIEKCVLYRRGYNTEDQVDVARRAITTRLNQYAANRRAKVAAGGDPFAVAPHKARKPVDNGVSPTRPLPSTSTAPVSPKRTKIESEEDDEPFFFMRPLIEVKTEPSSN